MIGLLTVWKMMSSCPPTAVLARVVLFVLLCLPLLCLPAGCELMKYSPHQDDLPSSASRVNEKNIARIQAVTPDDTLRFAFVSDTQNHYDDTQEFVASVNARDNIDFVVHGGDITHFGVIQEYQWMHEIFSDLTVPYLAVIGNHDLLANGGKLYDSVYGKRNFAFVHARTKFVFLDTNSRQYGNPGDVPDLPWLREQIAPSEEFARAIVVAHAPPSHPDFDEDLEQPFGAALEESTTVPLVLYGHEHQYSVQQPYGDVIHLVTPSVKRHQYVLVSISEDDVDLKRVEF